MTRGSVVPAAGRVIGIYVAAFRGELPVAVKAVAALAGAGLAGDRYASGRGTWSNWPGTGREVTLIAAEALESLPESCRLTPAEARRNLVTRGVDLDALVGRDFRIGGARLRGRRPCEPCRHLEALTRPGVAARLRGRGGLRADVLVSGLIWCGDFLEVLPRAAP